MTLTLPFPFEDGPNELVSHQDESHLPALAEEDRKLLVFTQQWTQHQSTIRAYLASFLGNSIAVDDALQEVALVVWQKGPWESEATAFLGYCLACARRVALAARRKLGDGRIQWLSPDAAAALADRVMLHEQQDYLPLSDRMFALRKCLEKIKPEHRELLESRYAGDSMEDLRNFAKRSKKNMDALYKTLERLRELLRTCLERGQHHTE